MEHSNNFSDKSFQRELNTLDDPPIYQKIYIFFYNVLLKKTINQYFFCILTILEAIQLNSYIFNPKHFTTWSLPQPTLSLLYLIFGSLRITPLLQYLTFTYFIILWGIILVFIFLHSLSLLMSIQFNKTSSRYYAISTQATRIATDIFITFLYIPFIEILIVMLQCNNTTNTIGIVSNGIVCYQGIHWLYIILSLIFLILFIALMVFITLFSYDPFNHKRKTVRVDITADQFLIIFKVFMAIQNLLINDEWVCIVMMLIIAIFNLKISIDNPSYAISIQQYFILVKNATFLWAYFILTIAKMLSDSQFNGQIYLLIFGYPLVIIVIVLHYQQKYNEVFGPNQSPLVVKDFIHKAIGVIGLIDDFFLIKSHKGVKNSKENRSEILLRGYIINHLDTCILDDCALLKFMENMDNFSIQKTCLLQHMNYLFVEGIKKFPESRMIVLFYISFNFDKKYNLNVAKTFLAKLDKGENTMIISYMIYCIKQNYSIHSSTAAIDKNRRSTSNNNDNHIGNNDEVDKEDQTSEQFHRLKFLIETSTKLYGEFWGNLASNISNNLNLHKLFSVGNKLNNYLREINKLWENELKGKRVDIENQGVIQLYAHFLRKILKNRKRGDDVCKKLNEEQLFESKKNEEESYEVDNLTTILEKQEFIIYSRSNEKGECQIFQCSNSIVNLLGYIKQDFIGKPIEIIMPSLYIANHNQMLSRRIKEIRASGSNSSGSATANGPSTQLSVGITPGTDIVNNIKDYNTNSKGAIDNSKKQHFVLPKTKIGYLLAMNSKLIVYKDDDFSHTYIIKTKFDYVDSKFNYGYYILANDEFIIDSISSSALHLGLSLDLLKKHVMNLSILIRGEDNTQELDLSLCYKSYEDEPKKITWVFPNIIYPKNDIEKQKDNHINHKDNTNNNLNNNEEDKEEEDLLQLIKQSEMKHFMLQITKVKYNAEECLGYCFRLSDCNPIMNPKRNNNNISIGGKEDYNNTTSIFNINYNKNIIFDLLRLSYTRTEIMPLTNSISLNNDYFQLGEGYDNKTDNDPSIIGKSPRNIPSHNSKSHRKKNSNEDNEEDSLNDNDNKPNELTVNLLTPDAIKQYQSKQSSEIRQFISTLPFFGNDILMERHRSNKERYTIGKISEPLIKITIDDTIKRIEIKVQQIKQNKHKDNNKKYNENATIDSISTPSTNVSSSMLSSMNSQSIINQTLTGNSQSMSMAQEHNNYLQGKLATDSSQYLSSIFNEKSVKYINILSLCIFLILAIIISSEFALSLLLLDESKARLGYVNTAYTILSGMMYTKFFLSEAIMAQNDAYPHKEGQSKKDYIQGVMLEMAVYRKEIFDGYSSFQNASVTFSDEYYKFTTNTTAYIRTIINTNPTVELLSFSAMMSRIPTNIFYVSTVTDNYLLITMENRNAYELMMNCLNDYMILWLKATELIVLNTKAKAVLSLTFLLIYILSFIVSVISLIILWFLIILFINDRERPVNLFITIKRQKFEDMKLSSEAFLNKLLNKFFGNEEAEDESLNDYSTALQLKPDDIMITKFNAITPYKQTIKSAGEYICNYINVVIFFLIFEAYMSFQYFYMYDSMNNVNSYTDILNVTHYSQSDMILNLNVYKSYFLDKAIPIFNTTNTDEVFMKRMTELTSAFERFIFDSFNSDNFLQSSYLKDYYMILNKDITLIIPDKPSPYRPNVSNGFKSIAYQYIELIRLLNVHFLRTNDYLTTYDNAVVGQLNYIVRYVIRIWYVEVIRMLNEAFGKFYEKVTLIQISLFIALLIVIILLYCLVWKNYVDKLKGLLKTSVDLINLIPEEIKDYIVQRMNEEEDKKNEII